MLSRRKFLRRCGAVLAATPILTSAPGFASTSATLDGGTFEPLRRGVGTYTNRGGTIGWLVNADVTVLVDTQYPAPAKQCWSGLQDRMEGALDVVINTHHHGDHTGGNSVFKPHAARMVAHANAPTLQKQAAEANGSTEAQVYAETTFEETWSESLGDETITLRHYGPAHTGGDAVIFFENANVVHLGDLVFNRAYPYIDVTGGGADTRNWITTLETLHETLDDDAICIHGHGNPEFGITGSRTDLLVMRDFLTALNEYVATQRQAGASLEEMTQIQTLDGFDDFAFDWPLSLNHCIEAVHSEQTS